MIEYLCVTYNVMHCIHMLYSCVCICIQAVTDEATAVVSMFNFDVLGSYSSWQCVELLLTHLPLLRLLLSVLLGSYKRVSCSFYLVQYIVGVSTCVSHIFYLYF